MKLGSLPVGRQGGIATGIRQIPFLTKIPVAPVRLICSRPIRQNPVYIGQETYRHRRCRPGSQRYERFKSPSPGRMG